jgi:hypothetical protein
MTTIGSTAPGSLTINYDALLSTTLMAYRPTLIDNIFKSSAFLAALRKADGIDYQDGGERIQIPLMYEENDTVKSYSGYEPLVVKPQDGITSAFFPWSEIGGTISISRLEERKNSGEKALLKLLEKKTMQSEMSMKSQVNKQLLQGTVSATTFVPGNSAKDLLPLGYFLRYAPLTDPVVGGNVGEISAASYNWWAPKIANFASDTAATGNAFGLAVTTWKGLVVGMKRMWNHCSRGADGSGPNLIVGTQNTYEAYESALDQNVRYLDTELADMGFDNIKLKGATFIWDELVPDLFTGTVALTVGSAFFLNTKFYKLVIDSQTDFVTTPFIEPENQTAKTAKVLFMGQATVSNARKNGMVCRIDETLVA